MQIMGVCSSSESTSVATAKLILDDGQLQEFPCPIKVSQVMQKINPSCFICNSDDMEFDDFVLAINGDEELLPGHLYFALPVSWLEQPLQAEEMASLAVKASSALMKSGGVRCGCCPKGVEPVVFLGPREVKSRRVAAVGDGGVGGEREGLVKKRRERNGGGGGRGLRRHNFTKLSVVFEE